MISSNHSPRRRPRLQRVARIASVNALRGLTILLMIFVNDLGPAGPSWMHHIQPPNADGMTLADVVFPAFLFIVGVSIPLALEPWSVAGSRRWRQVGHILSRTVGLLFMGLIQLNGERDRTLGGPIWDVLAFTSLIFAWCVVSARARRKANFPGHSQNRRIRRPGRVCWRYSAASRNRSTSRFWGHVEEWAWLRTEWWGILGLIGWAYLTVAILWLILGRRREWLMGAPGDLDPAPPRHAA